MVELDLFASAAASSFPKSLALNKQGVFISTGKNCTETECLAVVRRTNKSYTIDMMETPKEGWEHWKRYMANGIHYRIDLAGLVCLIGEEKASEFERASTAFTPNIYERYMRYTDIFALATKVGILPELVVDEEHYYRRAYIAPYRVAFETLRRGMTCWDLYVELLKIGRLLKPQSFMWFMRGLSGDALRRMPLETVVDICLLVGLEPGDLFRPKAHAVQRVQWPMFLHLRETLAALDDVDIAALTGVAAAMARGDDKAALEVLEWRKEVKCNGRLGTGE